MPRTTITEENQVDGKVEQFPSVKFSQASQRERIYVGLEITTEAASDGSTRKLVNPWSEWVHRIEAPKVENGYAMQKPVKNPDGSEGRIWDLGWIGSPICVGKRDILADQGDDPDNCPACALAREDRDACSPPQLRYAMNVLRYNTQPGTFNVINPFSCQILAWKFTVRQFGKLVEIQRNIREGQLQVAGPGGQPVLVNKDLTLIDLNLGPAEKKGPFFQYELTASEGIAACRARPENVAFVRQLLAGAPRASDEQLQAACGRRVTSRSYLEMDLSKAAANWRTARLQAGGAPASDNFGQMSGPRAQQDMGAGLSTLAQQAAVDTGQAPPAAQPAQAASVLDDFATATPAPANGTAAAVSPVAGGIDHFAQAAAPEVQQLAVQQQAALAAIGAPVAGAMVDDPFIVGAADTAPATVAPQPSAQPGPAAVGPDPFGEAAPAPAAQPAQPAPAETSFDELTSF